MTVANNRDLSRNRRPQEGESGLGRFRVARIGRFVSHGMVSDVHSFGYRCPRAYSVLPWLADVSPGKSTLDQTDPARTVSNDVSVQEALDDLKARQINSSLVTNERGELLGTVSKDQVNRKVGGLGHDPETEVVQAQVEPSKAECFEDQTVAEAKDLMLDAKVDEIVVVTRAK